MPYQLQCGTMVSVNDAETSLEEDLTEARRLAARIAGRGRWAAAEAEDGTWDVETGSDEQIVARGLTEDLAEFFAAAAAMWPDLCTYLERLKVQRDAALAPLDEQQRQDILGMLPPLTSRTELEQRLEQFIKEKGTPLAPE
jgi:hypothetical protein